MIATLRTRFRAAPRTTRILITLVGLHLVLKLVLFAFVSQVDLCCDQVSYDDGAMALSNLVRDLVGSGPIDVGELQRNLVGGGWFTPGSSIMLAPLYVVDPHASTFAIRAYLGLVSTLLLLFTVVRVRRVLGDLYAIILMVLPGLIPTWLLFSFGAWGDLVAGLLATILLMELITLMRTLVAGKAPTITEGIRFGAAAVVTVYARSSTTLLVAGIGVVLGFTALALLRGAVRWRAVLAFAVAAATFGAILAPWSVFASHTLRARVITTTTVPIVLANTFGNLDRVCFGPCDPVYDPGSTRGNIWFAPMQYSREVDRSTGRSEVEVEKQMWTYTRPSVTAHSYAADVIPNFFRYAGKPASFTKLLVPTGVKNTVPYWLMFVITYLGWIPLLGAAFALMVRVVRSTIDQQIISLLTTLSLGTLFTQPFVHVGTGRYWTTAAPIAAIALGLLLQMRDARRPAPRFGHAPWTMVPGPAATVAEPRVRQWLIASQYALAAATVMVVVLVLALGLT